MKSYSSEWLSGEEVAAKNLQQQKDLHFFAPRQHQLVEFFRSKNWNSCCWFEFHDDTPKILDLIKATNGNKGFWDDCLLVAKNY